MSSAGYAFGLQLNSDVELAGVQGGQPAGLPDCRISIADERELRRMWPKHDARRVLEHRDAAGAPLRYVDVHAQAGIRVSARYFGDLILDAGGQNVRCCPAAIAPWRWHQLLTGWGLPLAASRRGYQVLHASAVAYAGRVIAFVGPVGSGKTTIATELNLSGRTTFVSDDVLVLERRGAQFLVHPGVAITSVRLDVDERLAGRLKELGAHIGRSGRQKSHYAVEREARVRPLERLYFFGPGDHLTITPLAPVPPPLLLGSAFMPEAYDSPSAIGLLEACQRISQHVRCFALAPGSASPVAVAELVLRHLAGQAR